METLELDWVRLVTKSKQETAIDGLTSKATSYLELNCLLPADPWWLKNKAKFGPKNLAVFLVHGLLSSK